MPLSKAHKARTRQRILDVAGDLFRRRGYDRVGIDQIMAAADLTRGGFYGHFSSKAELFAEIVATDHGFNRKMAGRRGSKKNDLTEEALAIVADYLDPAHREIVGAGCSLASLAADTARAGAAAKIGYSAAFRDLVAEFSRGLRRPRTDGADPRALGAVATAVGGLVIARALAEDDLAAELLAACRAAIERELTNPRAR